jgi:multidrug resistance efflux pump
VIKVSASDNEYVEHRAVLVEIDPQDYQVAVDKARADLANAEADLLMSTCTQMAGHIER